MIHLEDFCLALNAQLMGTVADLGRNINVAEAMAAIPRQGPPWNSKVFNGQVHFTQSSPAQCPQTGSRRSWVACTPYADGGRL